MSTGAGGTAVSHHPCTHGHNQHMAEYSGVVDDHAARRSLSAIWLFACHLEGEDATVDNAAGPAKESTITGGVNIRPKLGRPLSDEPRLKFLSAVSE